MEKRRRYYCFSYKSINQSINQSNSTSINHLCFLHRLRSHRWISVMEPDSRWIISIGWPRCFCNHSACNQQHCIYHGGWSKCAGRKWKNFSIHERKMWGKKKMNTFSDIHLSIEIQLGDINELTFLFRHLLLVESPYQIRAMEFLWHTKIQLNSKTNPR